MNSIVERLRQHALPDPHDEREVMHAPLLKEAADRIEQQAERIKELEAERDWLHHKSECLNMERKSQDKELAALRQRIADAPVVAWGHFWKIDGEEILQWPVASSAEEAAKDIQMYAEGDREQMSVKPLINKEDLQQ